MFHDQQTSSDSRRAGCWRFWPQATLGPLTALLLVPVPVFATYTLGTWSQVAGPDNWTPVGSGLDLALTPVGDFVHAGSMEFDFVAKVSGSANSAGVSTSNFNAFRVNGFSSGSGLTVTIGFSPDSNPAHMNRQVFLSDQFTGTLPSSLTGSNSTQSIVNGDYAVVKFVFDGNSSWGPTVPSSPVHITFNGN